MASTKATALTRWCADEGIALTRFDYFAHGESGGDLMDFTIGQAIADGLRVLDELTQGPLVVIGSSMGAWVALHLALARPERVRGLIGIAAAPDFTERLMLARMSPQQRATLEDEGALWVTSDYSGDEYPVAHRFITEARTHLLLDDLIAISVPVHLLHGQADADVPWQTSLILSERLISRDVALTLVKDGDHRLNREEDLALMFHAITQLRSRL